MPTLRKYKKIYFRLDYGGLIGKGHLSRCISLAKIFQNNGFEIVFVIRQRPSILNDKLPFSIVWLDQTGDAISTNINSWKVNSELYEAQEMLSHLAQKSLVFLDHYSLGSVWQNKLRSEGHKVILIQDHNSKDYDADVLINYNIYSRDMYINDIAEKRNTLFLIGTDFVPLDDKFSTVHEIHYKKENLIEIVGVYLGGVQKSQLIKIAFAISNTAYFLDKKIDWIVNSHEEVEILRTIFSSRKIQIFSKLNTLIPVYERAHLFIGSCGISFLERACMGIWQICICLNESQSLNAQYIKFHNLGSVIYDSDNIDTNSIMSNFNEYLKLPQEQILSEIHRSFNLTDGAGAARIVNKILNAIN
jgi:UDP-2,4-diacetamido-2,4,6-trideoxy-beta-L-altropyranose hydrolase